MYNKDQNGTNNESNDRYGNSKSPSSSEVKLAKNFSTPNLMTYNPRPSSSRNTSGQHRQSMDASTLSGIERITTTSFMHEHLGEHGGLGISGLRRIRQQPSIQVPKSAAPSVNPSRSGSLSLQTPIDLAHPPLSTTMASPSLAFAEDLSRFPTESLHSFSFATQSDESISNRQNILKRSIDFMRDKKGWAASNPGLVAAQARLNGDMATQSMLELLARSNLIGGEAGQVIGLGLGGPLTGPAELSGQNVFDQSFNIPRSSSPDLMDRVDTPTDSISISKRNIQSQVQFYERLSSPPPEAEINRKREEKPIEADTSLKPFNPRAALKRTFTSTDDLKVQTRLNDVLAQPYTIEEEPGKGYTPSTRSTSAPYVPVPSISTSEVHSLSHASAPHGHSRYTPAAQAVFTTEAHSPWTITAANDLACLVFGVTRAEVRKLGILEVVREERRKWLEEKLRDPDSGTSKDDTALSKTQSANSNSSSTSTLNMRSGITAKLLSKPSSRESKRSQTEDGSGASYAARSKVKGGLNHTAHKSRGVILCGDVVPIQKRNGALGSASLWVKEKKGGLIWVLEEIAEDVATVEVDATGCITRVSGDSEAIWGTERVRAGMDIQRLIPAIPRLKGTNTGALDFDEIGELRSFTARTSNSIDIPVMIQQLIDSSAFRVSSFPHIAGIMVISSDTLNIRSSNSVFSEALFGYAKPEGMHVNEIIPGFDRLLSLMTDEDHVALFEGIVIPEHSFRRARALLAMREGRANAAAAFFKPSGMPARHRDGAEVMVDIQMRVARSEKHPVHDESAVSENEDPEIQEAEIVYALWITYSRQLHAVSHGVGTISPLLSRPGTPPHQPSPGQTDLSLQPIELPDEANGLSSPRAEENGAKQLGIVLSTNDEEKSTHKKTINDFVVLEDMGQGAYGQVKLCRSKLPPQNKVVIKYVTKRRILVDTWTRDRKLGTVPLEIHVLDYLRRDGLKHPNIVEMSDFFEDEVNYYIEMVPHGLPGMDLFDYIELRVNMDEDECRKIFVQVVEAVWHLHIKAKVVHRDIKDENVILDGEGNIKLIDFGSAAYIKSGPFDVFVGTIDYAAPEVLAGQSYRGKEQDVWALGILLYTIVYKENPFYSIDEIMDHDLRVPYVMSEASIDLIRMMLNRDVDQRITISEVLEHRWCKGIGAEADAL